MESSTDLPKLYEYTACPYCCKVRAILKYKGIPYERIEVHPINKKEIRFSKEWKKVPIWEDVEGKAFKNSTDIMMHLDQVYPDIPVFEKLPVAQTAERQWLDWADDTLVQALPPVLYDTFGNSLKAFNYITKISKFSWFQRCYIKYLGAFIMKQVANKAAKKHNITNRKGHFESILKEWESALDTHQYLGREKPNAADLAVYGILKSIEQLHPFSIVQANDTVYKWFGRMESFLNKKDRHE